MGSPPGGRERNTAKLEDFFTHSKEIKSFANLALDQAAQTTAQTLAYYYIHPALGLGLSAFNLFTTLSGIDVNPDCVQ
jgi:hypothetical protein